MFISNSIKTEPATITPEIAEKLLAQNSSNRKVSQRNLDVIKESMSRGEWVLNGEAIKVDRKGKVLDGQHRLMACLETGTTFKTLVVYGLPDAAQDSMDTGKSRTLADVLSIRGYKNAAALAAIVVAIMRAERWGIRAGAINQRGNPITIKQAMARIEVEPDLTELPTIVMQHPRVGISSRTAGLLYYVLTGIDPDDAQYFFDKLLTGEGLERGNPILTLRNQLINLKSERGQKKQDYIAALAIKAWNKFRDGEKSSVLRFTPGGANPEAYPEPK